MSIVTPHCRMEEDWLIVNVKHPVNHHVSYQGEIRHPITGKTLIHSSRHNTANSKHNQVTTGNKYELIFPFGSFTTDQKHMQRLIRVHSRTSLLKTYRLKKMTSPVKVWLVVTIHATQLMAEIKKIKVKWSGDGCGVFPHLQGFGRIFNQSFPTCTFFSFSKLWLAHAH